MNKEILKNNLIDYAFNQEHLNIANLIILVLNMDGVVTYINQPGCDVLGLKQTEVIGQNWIDHFIPCESMEEIRNVFLEVVEKNTGIPSHFENHILKPNKEKVLVSWFNSLIHDDNHHVIGVLSFGEDVTKKRLEKEQLENSERHFKNMFEEAPFGYQSLDENGYFLDVNKKWTEVLGYTKEEIQGMWFGDLLDEKHKNVFKKRFELFKEKGKIHSEFPMIHKNGEMVEVVFEGVIAYDEKGKFLQTRCTLNNITELNIVNKRLEDNEFRLRQLLNLMPLGIAVHEMIYDEDGKAIDYKFINCNGKFEEQTGLKEEDIVDKTVFEVLPDTERYWLDTYAKVVSTGKTISYENYSQVLKKYYKVIAYKTEGNRFVTIVDDITEEKEKQNQIEYLSIHDYLTDLYNRRFFVNQFKNLDKLEFYPLGIMMFDLNGLKLINDAFGHDVGDVALRSVAKILCEVFKEDDIVARIGGDEFAALVPNASKETIDLIRNQIQIKSTVNKVKNISISMAVGYEIKDENSKETIDEILKTVENKMYRHKLSEGVSMRNNAIKVILQTLTDKYEEEKAHSLRVSSLCKKMGEVLGFDQDDIKELELAGLFHDIGKISLPDVVLYKPDKLTQEEYEIIKTHPEISYQILRAADDYSDLAIHALYHHERWDGKGYPSGKFENDIPLFSRIICIADAFEAMTAIRPYKEKMTVKEAINEIIRCSGTQFDPRLSKIFVEKVLHEKWLKK